MINSEPGKIGRVGAQWLTELCDTAEMNKQLISDWNHGFLDTLRTRLAMYGDDCHLSEKQIHRLKEIAYNLGMI